MKKTTMSEHLERIQAEKSAARPMQIDFRVAMALQAKALEELMDDKYCALHDQIDGLRLDIRDHETRFHWLRPIGRIRWWWVRLKGWWKFRNDERYRGYDDYESGR